MRVVQSTGAVIRAKAPGALSVNVAQGEDSTAVLCLECVSKKGERVGYFQVWQSQEVLRQKLKTWRNLAGKPLFVDMAPAGTLPEAAEKVGVTNRA